MKQTYTAAAKLNPGRQSFLLEFRHPLRSDASGKSGKKVRKGLGTTDRTRAELIASQMTELLANDRLWSLGARGEAAKLYEPEVVEIFYSEIEPRTANHRPLRDQLLPLPTAADGYATVVLIGVPGAGKTTLLRQMIGTHPKREAFPSTSLNRTTTFPTELVLRPGPYEAVVTFLSEAEARFEVEECVSSAIVEAVSGELGVVVSTLLEKSDMRFRLKYLLGDLAVDDEGADPYADEAEDDEDGPDDAISVTAIEREENARKVRDFAERVVAIAKRCKETVEADQGPIESMSAADRSAALDLIEEQADESQEFLELVSDILDELRNKFDAAEGEGRYEKSTTGWPRAWHLRGKSVDRKSLIAALRPFASVLPSGAWGKLLTPLVNGMRVQGSFRPAWATSEPRLVLMDTEGLGHKANATADLPEQTISLLQESQVILLVDSAKNGLTNYAAGKALEAIANTGMTRKVAMVFTHMDMASASGLKGQRLHEQIFAGVRNVIDNQLKALTPEAARYLLERLQNRTFFLGRLDKADAKGAEPELNRLLDNLMAEQPPVVRPPTVPVYDMAFLLTALQEATGTFRRQWHDILGISTDPSRNPSPWQTVKALTRRYAEGFGETFELMPTANLRTALESAVSQFLEKPVAWKGSPTPEEKREAIEQIKEAVSLGLPELARRRLRESAQPEWQGAWAPRGTGSTRTRKILIEGIYERWVPVPTSRGDQAVIEFRNELQSLVQKALEEFEAKSPLGESAQ